MERTTIKVMATSVPTALWQRATRCAKRRGIGIGEWLRQIINAAVHDEEHVARGSDG